MRRLRTIAAVLALCASTWASIVDNPAVCPDELASSGGSEHHPTPPTSHCCLTAPCRTPVVTENPAATKVPVSDPLGVPAQQLVALTSIDSPAPPTPPPTSLDQA